MKRDGQFEKKQAPYGAYLCSLLAATIAVTATETRDKENPNQPFAAVAVIVATTSATIVAA